jgi:hypothetical protein
VGKTLFGQDRFSGLDAVAKTFFQATDLSHAEVVVYPHEFEPGERTREVAEKARVARLPCLFFYPRDDSAPFSLPYGELYRYALYADLAGPREHVMPAFCNDVLAEVASSIRPLKWQSVPQIGFCGYVGTPLSRLILRTIWRREKAAGLYLRDRALRALCHSDLVRSQFLPRTAFFGGASRRASTDARRAGMRREFLENLTSSPYVLCLRGKGN